ncbi:MAG: LacI family DNA-binding transcriptional regulator [Spirochaetales bacterium]
MTINDIAREAQVSTATVSRVMNNKAVSTDRKARVEAAIAKLNYVPNRMARALMSKSSHAIGVLTTSMSNQYYMEITEVIERRFRDKSYMQFLCCTDGDQERERTYIADLVSRQVDGIIIIDPALENIDSGYLKAMAGQVPLVLVHPLAGVTDIDSVVIDQQLGMARVMDYLAGLGHIDIGFVGGVVGYSYSLKEDAWRRAHVEAGRDPAKQLLVHIEDANTENAVSQTRLALARLLNSGTVPTALFACNDLMAIGILEAAAEVGLRVPDDLTVIGHDNTFLAAHNKLTSVDLKMKSMGLAAADLLMHVMEGRDSEPRRILLTPDLVRRETSARPRSEDGTHH